MKLLLATDGSETAEAATDFVAGFPFPVGSEVRIVTVIASVLRDQEIAALTPEQWSTFETARGERAEEAAENLSRTAAVLTAAGLNVSTEILSGHPADEIIAESDTQEVDLIVVGSHGTTGFRRFLLGSVSNQVLQSATRSVLIVRKAEAGCEGGRAGPPAADGHPWRLLIGYDGSEPSDAAVDFCRKLDLGGRAEVRLLAVLPMVHMFRQDIRQEMDLIWQKKKESEKAALEAAADRLRREITNVTTELVEAADVSDALLAAGDASAADLIVLGHKGKGAVERFLLGSVTPRVAHHSCRSVLAVR